ncbi:spore germination protein [Rossellomorea aquimaris]|uniref:spore germination protein n=1 Tax=Rossellomorea aquimaris TaxID=189382 RepID=UPI0005C7FA91|nr:spore germination protein [Rossellomorea aquimaris]
MSEYKETLLVNYDMEENIRYIEKMFTYPVNQDLNKRELNIPTINKKAVLYFLNGMYNNDFLEKTLIPSFENIDNKENVSDSLLILLKNNIPSSSIDSEVNLPKLVNGILMGNTILLIEEVYVAFVIGTTSFEKRNVDKPQDENVLKGPKEAFVESISTNISLIRKQLRSSNLLTEYIQVGERGISNIGLLYMNEIVNPALLEKVKKRLEQITTDEILNLGILEQHLEERPYSIVPTILYTERPDRAVSFLSEGHVILLMDSSPSCLVLPVTFWSFFHTPEEHYSRWIYGNFSRLLRIIAIFITALTPAIYIAATNYHVEMLPTDLALAISSTREEVPFPAILEVLLLLGSFELIREGGIRVPTPIGPTIGIVGALILGQAAVEASIISPILVIVIAITGLASFAIPNLSLNYMVRMSTYIFLLFAGLWGFFGIAVCLTVSIGYLTSITSFDVPFLSPMAPHYASSSDMVFRRVAWREWMRPKNLWQTDTQRMRKPERRE